MATGGYQFFDDGFFGYGEPGDFQYFSVWHFTPIILLALAVVFVYKKRESIAEWKYERRFRFIMAFIMMMADMSYFWRLLYVGDESGIDSLMIKLPLQVCQWALICCIFMVTSKNDTLFGINYFLSLTIGIIPLLMPTVIVKTGPTYFRYYQFWMEHELPIFMTFYMMFVHHKKPRYRHIWVTAGALVLLSIPSVIANNRIPGANYMYLGGESQGGVAGGNVAQLFPESQLIRYISFCLILLALFHISYGVYLKISKGKGKP